ncbi:MAG TPA: carbon monoxide dehydrogenase subunit G [Gemmatimonadales bacterium]|nr:carbon monoxide dehydrogenase subunit G [Gemmatimonadales bacterium]
MKLEFAGAPEIAAPQALVWQRLMDPAFVASCAPAVESVETLDHTHFRVMSGLGVGSIKLRFALDVELSDLDPPTSARMSVQGKAPGSALRATTTVRLEPLEGNRTLLRWTASSDVYGTIASVGARLLKGTAKKLTQEFWNKFALRVAR